MQVPGLPGVRFRDVSLPLGDREISLYTASAVDVLTAASQGPVPYWSVAWPAGVGLARYLASQDLRGQSVLEVGCGVGISSLGAAVAGAHVLATDNETPALRLLQMNARRNALSILSAVADWRAWPLRVRFPLVIGSDVTYEPAAFSALLEVLSHSLAPRGEVLLTDPGRLSTSAFQQTATSAGWSWQIEDLPPVGKQPVFLYRLRRVAPQSKN